jgi:Fe-S cluster assembly protein SufD
LAAFDRDTLTKFASSVPSWRREQMEAAFQTFESLGEPTGAEEDWRYVDFDLPFAELEAVSEPGSPLEGGKFLESLDTEAGHVRIVDGTVTEAESDQVSLRRLADLEDEPERWSRVPVDHNKLAAAHAAFANDGIIVEVGAAQVMSSPLVIEVQGVTPGSATFPQVGVRVGENAEAQVLVGYRSAPDARLLMIPEVDLRVDAGGRLRFLAVQSLDAAATNVVHQRVTLGRDATGRIGEVGLGADLGRLDLGVYLEGDGSSSSLVGLYFGEGSQTLD